MKGLIIKDILTLRKSIATMLLMNALFFVFAFLSGDPSYSISMAALMFSMMTLTSMGYDNMTKWDRYALSLPVSRKAIVSSKYALSVLLSVASVGLSFVASYLLILPKSDMKAQELLLVAYAVFAIAQIYMSIMLPLNYKYGVERTRLISIGIITLPTALVVLLVKLGVELPSEEQLMLALKCSPLLVLAVIGGSYFASLKIYENKEF